MSRRGTSNSNVRGNTTDRERRKAWLMQNWESNVLGFVRCYRCGAKLSSATVTIDRIIPGARGGRYTRNNIRPACKFCNSATAYKACVYKVKR